MHQQWIIFLLLHKIVSDACIPLARRFGSPPSPCPWHSSCFIARSVRLDRLVIDWTLLPSLTKSWFDHRKPNVTRSLSFYASDDTRPKRD